MDAAKPVPQPTAQNTSAHTLGKWNTRINFFLVPQEDAVPKHCASRLHPIDYFQELHSESLPLPQDPRLICRSCSGRPGLLRPSAAEVLCYQKEPEEGADDGVFKFEQAYHLVPSCCLSKGPLATVPRSIRMYSIICFILHLPPRLGRLLITSQTPESFDPKS